MFSVALYSAIGGTETDLGKGVHSIDTGALAEERDPLQRQLTDGQIIIPFFIPTGHSFFRFVYF